MSDTPHPPVAFLGTGAMGSRMAMRLLNAGFPLTVWNRTPERARLLVEKGARLTKTPAEAVAGAAFSLVMVEGDEASQTIWEGPEGIIEALDPNSIAIECSTLSPGRVETLANTAARCRIRFIEAAVSGSLPQVEAGALVFLAGGAPEDVAKAETVFRYLGVAVHYLGSPPQASLAKLAVNGLLACHVSAVAEFHHLLSQAGLPAHAIISLLSDTPVASAITMASVRQITAADYAPLFPISLALKDLDYLATAAHALEAPLPMAACAQECLVRAITWQSQNISAVAKQFSSTPLRERTQK